MGRSDYIHNVLDSIEEQSGFRFKPAFTEASKDASNTSDSDDDSDADTEEGNQRTEEDSDVEEESRKVNPVAIQAPSCSICGRKFTNSYNMVRHMRSQHSSLVTKIQLSRL
jgi:hypothetical protein